MMSLAIFTACEKEESDSGEVELLSFGPTGAMHGDTLFIIGNNLDDVTAIELTGATVAKADFKKHTDEEIQIIIPESTTPGFITLVTSSSKIVSTSKLNLEVAPTVTSVTPEARPGANITIGGNYLNWVTSVTFADGKKVDSADFISATLTQLVVPVPMDARTGNLVLSYGGTEPLEIETQNALRVTLPMATAMAPNPVKHQADLTITGTNLDLVRQVRFTGVTAAVTQFVSQTATQLVIKVPQSATKGKLTLVAPSGVITETAELNLLLPVVTALTPTLVDPEGELTITGTDLDLVTSIVFPGVSTPVTTFISRSSTQIVVRLPAGTTKGKLTMNVLNSTLKVQPAQEISIVGGPTEVPFRVQVYGDEFHSNWEKWGGWGTSTQDVANTEQAMAGSKAIKATFSDAYGALQLHPKTTFAFPGDYSTLRLSIYGGANTTATSRVAIYMKDATDPTDAQKKVLTLVPGKYTTFEIPLSDFKNNPAKINEFVIQNYGTANMTIYVDEIGFY